MIGNIITVTLTLFAVIDIIGSIPIVLDLRKKIKHIHSEKIVLISLIIMIVFQFFGEKFLSIFGADLQSFAIVGSIIIFLIGLEMVLNVEIFKENPDESKANKSIVPIAFPIIAGAGSITTVISLNTMYDWFVVTIGVFINMVFVYLVLKSSGKIEKLLGPGGLAILRKVFGIILLSIAINMFKSNIDFSLLVAH